MLCALQKSSNQKVIARAVTKTDGPFLCPRCKLPLNIRKGREKLHHFAHKPAASCIYGKGESEVHRKAKQSIYDALLVRQDVSDVEMEKDWGEVVSDIYAVIRGTPIAIEVQISTLTMDCIIHRTEAYASLGLPVLWLPLFSDKLNSERYSPAAWEKWLHAAYFGHVYYWLADLMVLPIEFASYIIEVEEKSWGNEYSSGYSRRSKRWRKPVQMPPVSIAEDFLIRPRKAWSGGAIYVPACRVLID